MRRLPGLAAAQHEDSDRGKNNGQNQRSCPRAEEYRRDQVFQGPSSDDQQANAEEQKQQVPHQHFGAILDLGPHRPGTIWPSVERCESFRFALRKARPNWRGP